jgi:hypothetical protein
MTQKENSCKLCDHLGRSDLDDEIAWTAERYNRTHPSKPDSTSEPPRYPLIRMFVKDVILPDELASIEDVITLYTQKLIDIVKEQNADSEGKGVNLNLVIYSTGPFPGHVDSGASGLLCEGSSELQRSKLDRQLKKILQEEGFLFDYRLGAGF